jgi:oligopeptide transport system substrate-binding protein
VIEYKDSKYNGGEKKKMKKLLTLVVALALAMGLFACGSSADKALNWNIGADPATLDPGLNGASDGAHVINNTFEGLVREVNSQIYPGIAETWTTSSDGKTITFNLRHSKWSDGSELTANDFVYAWKRAIDSTTASEYSWIWEYTNVENAYDILYNDADPSTLGVTALDDYTLQVKLTNPTPYFVSLMSFFHFMPVKQSAVEAEGGNDGLWAKDPQLVVCNGPFKLTEYNSGEGLKLVKNDNYWDAKEVYIDEINGKFIEEASTAYVAYNSGSLDAIPSVPNAMVGALIAENPEFHVFPLLGTYYYNFNMDEEIFQNANLRKALAYAINREAITEALSAGQIPATAFVPPGFTDNEGKDFAAEAGNYGIATDDGNYSQAVTLFAQAAADMNMTVAELQDALKGKVVLYNTSEGHKLVAEMVQESWKTVLGVEVDLQNQEWAVFQDTRQNGDYDISRGGWLTDYMDPSGMLAIFTSENAYNDPNYDNPDYDTLLSDSQSTSDVAVHFQKLYQAQDMLMADMPVIPVYYYADTWLIKSYVTDWGRSVLGSIDFTHAKLDK